MGAVPPAIITPAEREAFTYWRARALETRDSAAATAAYREIARGETPFAAFARRRLAEPLPLDALRRDYESRPPYRAVLHLAPEPFPRFPPGQTDRTSLLLAMGLYDEAAGDVPKRWPLHPQTAALTQSLALQRGNAARESIYAAEVLMKSVPRDFVPELLPPLLRQLLYPRYFYGFIASDAEKFGADPNLVLAIMREESRFNPRAKSEAAARGLLQFIITTAREIGRDAGLVDLEPDDLYDPRIVIRLGAKYIAELSDKFGGNRYKIAAAYNAGPNQTALWARLAPTTGDDAFVTAVSFDETEGYVRKVSRSYEQYVAIYGKEQLTRATSRPSRPQ
jgi:soluble lytic murein transglycosylase